MAPYDSQSFHGSPSEHQYPSSKVYHYSPSQHHYQTACGHRVEENLHRDVIISSLMEKLADREAEIRKLDSEKSELENDLRLKEQQREQELRKLETLEITCKELTNSLRENEDHMRVLTRDNNEQLCNQRQLEIICCKLERVVDNCDEELLAMKRELDKTQDELKHTVDSSQRQNQIISALKPKLKDLEKEVQYFKAKAHDTETLNRHLRDQERKLKSLLTENDSMLEKQEKEIKRLTRRNRGLERNADTQNTMAEEQDQNLTNMKRLILRLEDVIKTQDVALDKKHNAILQLTMDIEQYENVLEKAEHVTWGQRQKMKSDQQDREKMIAEIEMLKDELNNERSGFLSFLRNGCGETPRV